MPWLLCSPHCMKSICCDCMLSADPQSCISCFFQKHCCTLECLAMQLLPSKPMACLCLSYHMASSTTARVACITLQMLIARSTTTAVKPLPFFHDRAQKANIGWLLQLNDTSCELCFTRGVVQRCLLLGISGIEHLQSIINSQSDGPRQNAQPADNQQDGQQTAFLIFLSWQSWVGPDVLNSMLRATFPLEAQAG